ncbi:MAG: hypothetical protein AAFP90_01060 [Planctomycetota bacterium]
MSHPPSSASSDDAKRGDFSSHDLPGQTTDTEDDSPSKPQNRLVAALAWTSVGLSFVAILFVLFPRVSTVTKSGGYHDETFHRAARGDNTLQVPLNAYDSPEDTALYAEILREEANLATLRYRRKKERLQTSNPDADHLYAENMRHRQITQLQNDIRTMEIDAELADDYDPDADSQGSVIGSLKEELDRRKNDAR